MPARMYLVLVTSSVRSGGYSSDTVGITKSLHDARGANAATELSRKTTARQGRRRRPRLRQISRSLQSLSSAFDTNRKLVLPAVGPTCGPPKLDPGSQSATRFSNPFCGFEHAM